MVGVVVLTGLKGGGGGGGESMVSMVTEGFLRFNADADMSKKKEKENKEEKRLQKKTGEK